MTRRRSAWREFRQAAWDRGCLTDSHDLGDYRLGGISVGWEVPGTFTAEVQVRNQARVHLWYPQKFGRPYAPVSSAAEALTRFLAPCCAVGLRRTPGGPALAAPFGLDDLLAMVVRPNPALEGAGEQYDAKIARWRCCWPELTVHPWHG